MSNTFLLNDKIEVMLYNLGKFVEEDFVYLIEDEEVNFDKAEIEDIFNDALKDALDYEMDTWGNDEVKERLSDEVNALRLEWGIEDGEEDDPELEATAYSNVENEVMVEIENEIYTKVYDSIYTNYFEEKKLSCGKPT